jgi:RNA polymerase sigma-70 factor (ECF subfamily)
LQDDLEREAQSFEQFDDRDALEGVDSVEKAVLVREAVQRLSKEQRQAIELAFFQGLTQTEIAERLGEPLGTVKARIRRGMMRLRDVIGSRIY